MRQFGRDAAAVDRALGELRDDAADARRNLMPALLRCARAHATEGEIVESLQRVWGTYTEAPAF
jgi:methylmalonyl-CoA mutase, N-terminal domain